MDWRALSNGITTVFGWTPSLILLLFALFGMLSAVINFNEIPLLRSITLMLVGIGGLAGFVGMTAVSWRLKLPPKVQLYGLLMGIITLSYVVWVGATIENKWIRIDFFDWLDLYLFICPLVIALIHAVKLMRRN